MITTSKEIIIYHHLGLGDHFVCNGLVNYLSENYDKLYLICKQKYFNTVSSLYSDNKKITVIFIPGFDHTNEMNEVNELYISKNIKLLKIGFEHCNTFEWDRSFYNQFNIPFEIRYSHFKLPSFIPNMLSIPSEDFLLIHNSSRLEKYNLNITDQYNHKYVAEGITDNMLCYLDMIYAAKEIHCVNSSFYHFVDSLQNINANLYYHDIRRTDNTKFYINESKWKIIPYL